MWRQRRHLTKKISVMMRMKKMVHRPTALACRDLTNRELPEAFIVKDVFVHESPAAAAHPSMDPSHLLQAITESESAEELALALERRYRAEPGVAEPAGGESFDGPVGSFRMWQCQLWKLYIQVCSQLSQLFTAILNPLLTEGPARSLFAMD
jgi:hypothetical protein